MSSPPSKTHKISDMSSPNENDIPKSMSDIYNLDGRCDDENHGQNISPEKGSSSTPTSLDDSYIAEVAKGVGEPDSAIYIKSNTQVDNSKDTEDSPLMRYNITIQMGEIEDACHFINEVFKLHSEAMRHMHQVII